MPVTPITPAQIDEVARLAEIPPVGSEERLFWLEAAEQHGFEETDANDAGYTNGWLASEGAILTIMSEARKQGQRDVLSASSTTTEPSQVEPLRVSPADAASVSSRGRFVNGVEDLPSEDDMIERGMIALPDSVRYDIEREARSLVNVFVPDAPPALLQGIEVALFRAEKRRIADLKRERAPAFAAANPSGGWRDISDAPKDAASLLISDGHNVGEGFWHDGNDCYRADAGWFWEMDRGDLLTAKNAHATHWQPMPVPPSALAGEARQGQDAQRLDPKDDHAASSEATPSIPPSPRKGQEENPCPILPGGEAGLREDLQGLDPRFTIVQHVGHLLKQLAECRRENDYLRASLANGGGPCAYCNLPREEWAKCASGFPGCARGDDAMLCPHVGAGLEAEADRTRLEAENERLRAALAPFVGNKLPSLRRTERDYDRTGLRRMMSPMEIACKRALFALVQPQPEERK